MNDAQRAANEAWERRQLELAAVLRELGITPAEATLFNVLHYGLMMPPAQLAERAVYPDYMLGGTFTEEDSRSALDNCLSKGWLQVIDETVLAGIKEDLLAGDYLGPIYGFPNVDDVDFTHTGARLWQQLSKQCFHGRIPPPYKYVGRCEEVVHEMTAKFYRTQPAALAAIQQEWQNEDVVSVSGLTPIGPWRMQWWRRFDEGFQIVVEERRKWQGRASGGGRNCFWETRDLVFDLQRVADVVIRHNVTLAEWLVLASMENDCSSARGAAKFGERRFNVEITEQDCGVALQNCLRNGWLRIIDAVAVQEIDDLLAETPVANPAGMPAHNMKRIGFSSEGAASYKMLMTELFGPDWEDTFKVENQFFWEEHHYCESPKSFSAIAAEHLESGKIVTASRTVPIGPWCIYWWERFPAGYRLELEISMP